LGEVGLRELEEVTVGPELVPARQQPIQLGALLPDELDRLQQDEAFGVLESFFGHLVHCFELIFQILFFNPFLFTKNIFYAKKNFFMK
jgi:hypothetical protein